MPATAPAIDFPWCACDDGACAEISELAGNGKTVNGYCILPDGTTAHRSLWTAHRDGEGEITHWTYAVGGKVYTIFND